MITPVSDNCSYFFARLTWEMGFHSDLVLLRSLERNSGLKLICKSLPRSTQNPLSALPTDLRHCCSCSTKLSNQTQTVGTVGGGHLLKSSEYLPPHNIFIFHNDETGMRLGAPPPAECRSAHKGLGSHQPPSSIFLADTKGAYRKIL